MKSCIVFLSFKTSNLPEEKSKIHKKKTECCLMLGFIWVEIKTKLCKVDSYLQPAENAVVPSLAKTEAVEDRVARGGDTLVPSNR